MENREDVFTNFDVYEIHGKYRRHLLNGGSLTLKGFVESWFNGFYDLKIKIGIQNRDFLEVVVETIEQRQRYAFLRNKHHRQYIKAHYGEVQYDPKEDAKSLGQILEEEGL